MQAGRSYAGGRPGVTQPPSPQLPARQGAGRVRPAALTPPAPAAPGSPPEPAPRAARKLHPTPRCADTSETFLHCILARLAIVIPLFTEETEAETLSGPAPGHTALFVRKEAPSSRIRVLTALPGHVRTPNGSSSLSLERTPR